MIQKLRAWLLDIVREAIKLELYVGGSKGCEAIGQVVRTAQGKQVAPPFISELSFEAAQDAALEELRKNYDA